MANPRSVAAAKRIQAAQRSGNTAKATKLLAKAQAAPQGKPRPAGRGKAPAKATVKPRRQPEALPVPLQPVPTMTQEQVEAAVAALPKPPSKAAQKRAAKEDKAQAKAANAVQQAKERLLVAGDRVIEYRPAVGQEHVREGDVVKVWFNAGQQHARVRIDSGSSNRDVEDAWLHGPAILFRRTAVVSNGAQLKPEPAPDESIVPFRPKEKVDVSTYQVYQDINGVAYLRVGYSKHGAMLVVNKGFQVELIEMPNDTIRALYLQPVIGSSILDAANKLLHPMNDHATISVRAKAQLIPILENEELKNMATKKVPATKPAKFASVSAPAAKNSKKETAAKAAKKTTKTAGAPRAPRANSEELFATKVVATKAAAAAKEGSFFGMLARLASQPIVLSKLVDKVAAEMAKGMRSAKDPAEVARIRVRDAYSRLGILQAAK